MEKDTTFDLDLSFIRKEQGLSQRELASRMGITQPSLKQIEDNFNDIKVSSLKRYVNALGMKLTIKSTAFDGQSSTYLIREHSNMKKTNSLFDKIEEEKKERSNMIATKEQEEKKKKEVDERDLQVFVDEANKLSNFIKEKLQSHLTVTQNQEIVISDYYKSKVTATKVTFNAIDVYLEPTGPRFGRSMGRGVIEVRSNSKFLTVNPYITMSLILKTNKDDNYWVIHERNTISGKWKQEKLDEESLFKIFELLLF